MKRKTLISILVPVILIGGLILYSMLSGKQKELILETQVQYGQFEIVVNIVGELQAINETEINAPAALRSRNLRIQSVQIQDLIAEGTIVDSGDWVATLDRSEVDNSLKDILDNFERETTIYENAKLDSTMTLRGLRNNLISLEFVVEERKIALDQSKFEPPAVIRQAEIAYERAVREYTQAENNYALKVQQSEATIREAEINMERYRRSKDEMELVLSQFDIFAPAAGMVIYKKEASGQKRTAGSTITTRDLAVAALPNLEDLNSMTYANEIDVGKLKQGQKVRMVVDAFPDKTFTGTIISVGNMGQEIPNSNAKVYEVEIILNERDPILRPSMTTHNEIIIEILEDVLFIPLETVFSDDSAKFVYTIDRRKQEVKLGRSNENHVIVEEGLEKGERLYLSIPTDLEIFE